MVAPTFCELFCNSPFLPETPRIPAPVLFNHFHHAAEGRKSYEYVLLNHGPFACNGNPKLQRHCADISVKSSLIQEPCDSGTDQRCVLYLRKIAVKMQFLVDKIFHISSQFVAKQFGIIKRCAIGRDADGLAGI